MSIYSNEELYALGFAHIGKNVRVSKKASIYGAQRISLGDHVRIDDFCVISAGVDGVELGCYVHIAVFCSLLGAAKITMKDYSGLSSRVSIYSSSDDYSGQSLTNPTVPDVYKNVHNEEVLLSRHVIVGSGTVILPGSYIEEGVAVGALSLVNKRCKEFGIYSGVPARRIGERKRDLLEIEKNLLAQR